MSVAVVMSRQGVSGHLSTNVGIKESPVEVYPAAATHQELSRYSSAWL